MRGSRKTERDHNTTFSPISSDLSSEQKYFGDFPLMRLHKSLEIRVEVEQEEGMDANQSRDKIQHHQLHLKKEKPNLIQLEKGNGKIMSRELGNTINHLF